MAITVYTYNDKVLKNISTGKWLKEAPVPKTYTVRLDAPFYGYVSIRGVNPNATSGSYRNGDSGNPISISTESLNDTTGNGVTIYTNYGAATTHITLVLEPSTLNTISFELTGEGSSAGDTLAYTVIDNSTQTTVASGTTGRIPYAWQTISISLT